MSAFDPSAWVVNFEGQGGTVRFDLRSGKLWLGIDEVANDLLASAMTSITGWPGRREILKAWAREHRAVA